MYIDNFTMFKGDRYVFYFIKSHKKEKRCVLGSTIYVFKEIMNLKRGGYFLFIVQKIVMQPLTYDGTIIKISNNHTR